MAYDRFGVWRTVSGRRVFIEAGMSLTDALRASGKFSDLKNGLTGVRSSGSIGDSDGYTKIDDIRNVDFDDKVAVKHEIDMFLEKHSNAEVEHAIVITKSGKVYELTGDSNTVNPEIIGANELEGSVGAHNHPVLKGRDRGDSFSREDLMFSVRNKTGVEYLTSGNRRDAFVYTGNLSADEISFEYKKAYNTLLQTAMDGKLTIQYNEQELIMRILDINLEGFEFYG